MGGPPHPPFAHRDSIVRSGNHPLTLIRKGIKTLGFEGDQAYPRGRRFRMVCKILGDKVDLVADCTKLGNRELDQTADRVKLSAILVVVW